jgi:WD40 repeat protein
LLAPVEGATRLALWTLAAKAPDPTLIIDADQTIDFYRAAGEVVVMVNGASHTLRVHSLVDGRPVGPGSITADHALRYVELSADGAHLAAGSFEDSTVFLFDLKAPPETRPTALKRGSNIDATSAAFHPDGTWLATGDVHGAAIWPLSGPLPRVIAAHDSRVTGVAFAPDGSALASASLRQVTDGRLRLGYLDGRANRPLGQISSNRVAYGPGPNSMLLTGWRGVHLVDLETGDSRSLPDSPNSVSGVAIDATGERAAAAGGLNDSDDSVIRVWDLVGTTDWPAGERRLDAGDLGWVVDLAFLPDGSLLAASEAGLQQWDVEAGTFDWLVKGGAGYRVLGVDATGRIIATVAADFKTLKSGAIRVWDRQEGTSWEVTTHDDRLISLAVSPDGQHLISGDRDGVVRIGPVTGEEPHLLLGHRGTVWDLDVSPDSRLVVSAGNEGDLRLWSMPEGPPVHTLRYEDFVDRLRSLTNLRVLGDESYRSGYRLEGDPNPGWGIGSPRAALHNPESAE